MECVKVEVKSVIYPRREAEQHENGESYYVLEVWDVNSRLSYMAKGILWIVPRPKMILELDGEFTSWNGMRQFKWKNAEYSMPVSDEDMLHYACALTKGMGEAMARRIWTKKGEDWREVKEGDVPGFTQQIAEAFAATIEKLELCASYHQAIVWMLIHGLTEHQANKAFERFGGTAAAVIEENPYRLAEVDGVGFATVDTRIRGFFCIKDDDPRRLDALIDTAVLDAASEEGSAPKWASVWRRVCEMLGGAMNDTMVAAILRAVREKFDSGTLIRGDEERLMRRRDYDAEREIWEFATAEN